MPSDRNGRFAYRVTGLRGSLSLRLARRYAVLPLFGVVREPTPDSTSLGRYSEDADRRLYHGLANRYSESVRERRSTSPSRNTN